MPWESGWSSCYWGQAYSWRGSLWAQRTRQRQDGFFCCRMCGSCPLSLCPAASISLTDGRAVRGSGGGSRRFPCFGILSGPIWFSGPDISLRALWRISLSSGRLGITGLPEKFPHFYIPDFIIFFLPESTVHRIDHFFLFQNIFHNLFLLLIHTPFVARILYRI